MQLHASGTDVAASFQLAVQLPASWKLAATKIAKPQAASYNSVMLDFATTAFVSILFLVDPPGTVPAFIALTSRYSPEKRRKTALVASVAATLILMGFAAVGNVIFQVLRLTLPAFQIAGGLVLFLVALDMIRAQRSTQEVRPR
jgi:multiple antibiotic resistance protein